LVTQQSLQQGAVHVTGVAGVLCWFASYARSSCDFNIVCTSRRTLLCMVKMSCVLQGLTSSSSTGSICPFVPLSHGPHVMMGRHATGWSPPDMHCRAGITVCLRKHVYTLICRSSAQASAEHLVTRADVHASLGTPALSVQHTELEVLDLITRGTMPDVPKLSATSHGTSNGSYNC
jgi:hypothetical protein